MESGRVFFAAHLGEIVVFVLARRPKLHLFFFWRRRVVPSWKGHQRFFWGVDIVSVWGVTPGSLTYPLKMDSRKTVWEGNFSGAVLNIGRYSGVHVTQQMFFSKTKALTRISCFFDLNRREMDAVRAMLVNIATFALLPKFSGKSIASWQVESVPQRFSRSLLVGFVVESLGHVRWPLLEVLEVFCDFTDFFGFVSFSLWKLMHPSIEKLATWISHEVRINAWLVGCVAPIYWPFTNFLGHPSRWWFQRFYEKNTTVMGLKPRFRLQVATISY